MKTPKSKPKIPKAISQAVSDADPLASLKRKLKACDLEVQKYVAALEKENLKLTSQIAKFQVEHVTLNNRIKSLIKQNEKDKRTALSDAMSRGFEQLKKAEEADLIAKTEHEASKRDVSRFLNK
jgi:predicted nuclease with TOPRIM domain